MSISQQVFAPFATTSPDGRHVRADVNSFILRLLLFDAYVVESSMLRDVAQLAGVFGPEGLIDIINSGAVTFHVDALSVGQAERTIGAEKFPVITPSSPDVLPLLHYHPIVINLADRNVYVNRALKNLRTSGIGKKTISKMQNAVVDKLTTPPDSYPQAHQWAKASLLSNNEVTTAALDRVLRENHGGGLVPTVFHFSFRESGDGGYAVTTNVGRLFNISNYEEHKVFESAILKVMGFYQRLSLMNIYDAIAWFSDSDAHILDAELRLKINEYNSSKQEQRFTRILHIAGLPVTLPGQQINANSLLRLRETRECKQFREWLSTSDAKSDSDIKRELTSFRAVVSTILHTSATKAIRFILPNVASLSPIASMATQAADRIIIEKILPTNGPVAFINNKLPPVLRNDPYRN